MAGERHKLPLQRNLRDAFAEIIGQAFGYTPKQTGHQVGLDPRAARNALEGKAGTTAITQALHARQKANDDHYELWLALGQMIFGETLDEWEERRLTHIIESTENARKLVDARQARRGELRALAYTDTRRLDQRRA